MPKTITSVTYEAGGYYFKTEFETETVQEVIETLALFTTKLDNAGCTPAVYNKPPPKKEEKPKKKGKTPATGPAPICSVHGQPMKPSQYNGGWYCTAKLDDGTYCSEEVKKAA